jgi:hypothetical protein
VLSAADGRFKLSTPPYAPQYVVTAKKGSLTGSRQVQGETGAPVEVTLKAAVRLTGSVYLPDGRPAAGVEIEAVNVDRPEPVAIVTGQDGTYSVEVPPGAYRFGFDPLLGVVRPNPEQPLVIAEVAGQEARVNLGPAPGSGSVTIRLRPERGYALWVVRGDLPTVRNPPDDLYRVPYAQMLYQPLSDRVTFQGLPPGRYTIVWGSFHTETPGGPLVQRVDVPSSSEVVLAR